MSVGTHSFDGGAFFGDGGVYREPLVRGLAVDLACDLVFASAFGFAFDCGTRAR